MQAVEFKSLRSVLCLGAHPDDIEIGCSGTVMSLLDRHPGLHVSWIIFSGDPVRRREARRAASRILGRAAQDEIRFGNFRDSYFPYEGGDIKHFLQGIADAESPDLIFTHRREDMHQDHRTIAELTWNCFRDHSILEYEIPKYEGDLATPNVYQPLSERVARRKVELIAHSFSSQKSRQWFSDDTFWALLRLRGLECNSISRFAEGFTGRKTLLPL